MIDVRETLDRLIQERGDDYVSLSRMLGRNAAYIQQFIRRGSPRKLDEDDRRTLAGYFGVDEALLGAPPLGPVTAGPLAGRRISGVVMVPQLALSASAGPGAVVEEDVSRAHLGFEERWLRDVASNTKMLSAIQVQGDSMAPTLADADDILVDRGDAGDRLRDGVYVLRVDDTLIVKRVAISPAGKKLSIRSDNPAYPDWDDCDPATVDVIGRVVWVGRKLS
jgi:hypothetical protein